MGGILAILLLATWPGVRWDTWISGLEAPVDMQSARDGSGRLFVVEQRGRIRLIRNGSLVQTPVLDIVSRVQYRGEEGLLGLAFPPGFAQKQYFYVNYTNRQQQTVISRFRISGDAANAASEEILLTIDQPYGNHNGGCLQFSPRDGRLYIGMGDGGSGGDPQKFAQNPNSLLGKMLRMDVEGGSRTPEIGARGLRNPWRFSFDRETHDLYIADVGQNLVEEVNFTPAGSAAGLNYGWSLMEGNLCYDDGNCASRTDLVRPFFTYPRAEGVSISGGYVYRGAQYPFARGMYFFGDFGSGNFWASRRSGNSFETQKLGRLDEAITGFAEDEAGELYLIAYSGRIRRLVADPPPPGITAVVNGASFAPGLAAGGIASAFLTPIEGVNGVVGASAYPLPTTLSGVSVTVNGTTAPLYAVAGSPVGVQVNFQVPMATATGEATVAIRGAERRVPVSATAPALFTFDGRIAAVRGNGRRGEAIELYATSLGAVSNAPLTGQAALGNPLSRTQETVEVTVGGVPATVLFSGLAPGFAGLYQVNILIPQGIAVGEAPVVIRAGGQTSPAAYLVIQP